VSDILIKLGLKTAQPEEKDIKAKGEDTIQVKKHIHRHSSKYKGFETALSTVARLIDDADDLIGFCYCDLLATKAIGTPDIHCFDLKQHDDSEQSPERTNLGSLTVKVDHVFELSFVRSCEQANGSEDRSPNAIRLFLSATALKPMDSYLIKADSSDPYCLVRRHSDKTLLNKTDTLQGTLNPQWTPLLFSYAEIGEDGYVLLEVFDCDNHNDRCIEPTREFAGVPIVSWDQQIHCKVNWQGQPVSQTQQARNKHFSLEVQTQLSGLLQEVHSRIIVPKDQPDVDTSKYQWI
jgi:hypothetical protein